MPNARVRGSWPIDRAKSDADQLPTGRDQLTVNVSGLSQATVPSTATAPTHQV
jgi:hypothetical protein